MWAQEYKLRIAYNKSALFKASGTKTYKIIIHNKTEPMTTQHGKHSRNETEKKNHRGGPIYTTQAITSAQRSIKQQAKKTDEPKCKGHLNSKQLELINTSNTYFAQQLTTVNR